MRLSDVLWFSALAAVLALVGWIGVTMVTETVHTTAAIENVYRIRDWASQHGPRSQTASPLNSAPAACLPPEGSLADCANWLDDHPPKTAKSHRACTDAGSTIKACLEELTSAEGELKDLRNPFNPKAPIFTSSCSAAVPKSLGAILVQVGKPKSATDQSLEYRPLKSQSIDQAAPLRLIVCGRLYRHSAPIDFSI
jgi:hypothetical protein